MQPEKPAVPTSRASGAVNGFEADYRYNATPRSFACGPSLREPLRKISAEYKVLPCF